MNSFKLKPGLSSAFLPGAGKVIATTMLKGEQFQRFVPQFLVEVLEESRVEVTLPVLALVAEPVVVPELAPVPVIVTEPVAEPVAEVLPEPAAVPAVAVEAVPAAAIVPEPMVEVVPVPAIVPEPMVEVVPAPAAVEVIAEVTPAEMPAPALDSPEGAVPAIVETSPSTPARPVEKKKKR